MDLKPFLDKSRRPADGGINWGTQGDGGLHRGVQGAFCHTLYIWGVASTTAPWLAPDTILT